MRPAGRRAREQAAGARKLSARPQKCQRVIQPLRRQAPERRGLTGAAAGTRANLGRALYLT